jgi:hypothetical protein
MKRKAVFAIMVVVMFSAVFAATYDTGTKQLTYNLGKGWNLLPIGIEGPPVLADNSAAGAVYVWISPLKRYAGGIVKDGSVSNSGDYSEALLNMKDYSPSAMWVYLKKDITFSSYAITSPEFMTGEGVPKKLAKGWNFVVVWPYMTGIKFNELMGDCSITKMNTWNSAGQRWGQPTSSTEAANQMKSMNNPFSDLDVGKTILLYAESECEIRITPGEAMTPPALPE